MLRLRCGCAAVQVFEELETMLKVVEKIDGITFAKDDQYGYVTSCPSNLGTGMRASVHVKIPNLTADGMRASAITDGTAPR